VVRHALEMTKLYVVDTNVVVTANGKSSNGADCEQACLDAVLEITDHGARLAIDDGWRIIKEYRENLDSRGQRSVARTFLKWVFTNHHNPQRCVRVAITPRGPGAEDFQEFPSHQGLSNFDPSDRKFVAVAAAHPDHPPILQATDTKWWGWNEALAECGIQIKFLCPEEIAKSFEKKFSR
jgi:hypothetical protein